MKKTDIQKVLKTIEDKIIDNMKNPTEEIMLEIADMIFLVRKSL